MRCALATAAATGAVLGAAPAGAQPSPDQPRPGPAYKAQPLNLQKEKLGSAGLSDVALSRMRSGDCAGALEAFDAALRTLTDPALHRDRGLCHEQLGHVYPAIDDYRAYLTEMPEAPDADGIRRGWRSSRTTSGRTG